VSFLSDLPLARRSFVVRLVLPWRGLSLPELVAQGREELAELLADLGGGVAVLGLLECEVDGVEPAG